MLQSLLVQNFTSSLSYIQNQFYWISPEIEDYLFLLFYLMGIYKNTEKNKVVYKIDLLNLNFSLEMLLRV